MTPGSIRGHQAAVLNGQVSWSQNRQWLDERVLRGDTFGLATDPASLSRVHIPEVPNGYLTFRELRHLAKAYGIKPKALYRDL